jgi:hypothetical protein
VLKLNSTIIWTHVFKWYIIRWGSKNGNKKTCKKKGLVQKRLNYMLNKHNHFISTIIFILIMNKVFR